MTAHQPKQPMIQIIVLIIWQFVTAMFSNSMEQLLWFQRKQIVIRMRMIQHLQSALNSVSKLSQVNTKPLQDYNDAVANAA